MPNSKFFVALLLILSTLAIIGNQLSTNVQGLPQYGSPQAIVTGQSTAIAIAVDGAGNIYWANQGNGLLLKLPKGSTTPTVLLSGLQNVQGVGVDAAGNVYYDEYFQGILYRLALGSSTPQVLQTGLDYPNFMSAAANGTVFFVTGQTCGDKIVRFNPSTSTLTTIVTAPTPHDTNHGFSGLFIHPSGDLYYTTCQYNSINRLPAGTSNPQLVLNAPYANGISVDNQGNIFYSLYLQSIDVLPYGSTTPTVIASGPSAYGHQLALDSNGNIFYTDSNGTTIWEIPVIPTYGQAQELVTGQQTPIGIAVDSAGTLYWANQYSQLLKLGKSSSTPTVILSGLNNVIGLGIDAAGNLYYDEYTLGSLYELPAGSNTPQVLASGLDYPNFLSVDSTGSNVYLVTGQTCGDKIVKFNLASHTLTTVLTAPSPHDTNHGFGGLFIHSSGDLYYTTCAYNTVNRLPAGSSTPLVLVNTPSTPTPWVGSSGVAVDSVGNVFYTLYEAVYLLPAGSSTPVLLTSQGCNSHEMALDQDDNVFYTDSPCGVIWKIPVLNLISTSQTTSSFIQSSSTTSSQTSQSSISSTSSATSTSAVTSTLTQSVTVTLTTTQYSVSQTQSGYSVSPTTFIQVSSNSTISNFQFDSSKLLLNFTVSGPSGTIGYTNVVIAKSLLNGSPAVLIDDGFTPVLALSLTSNSTHYFIAFTYHHSTHQITIGGSNAVPEFPISTLPLMAVALLMISVMVQKRRNQHHEKQRNVKD